MKTKHQLNLSARVIHRGDQPLNNPIRRRWFALRLGGLLLTSICALLPSPAQAQCKNWDISGQWVIRHKGGAQLRVNLTQEGAGFTGTGRLTSPTKDVPDIAADILGNITDDAFTMAVTMGKLIERYSGRVGPDGKIEGDCHLESERGKTEPVHWYGSRKMKCADEADKSSSSDSEDQTGKHKKNKKKHHHHDDDDQDQGKD
jgi:hypothetical protein